MEKAVSEILSTGDDTSVIKRQFLAGLNHEIRTPLSGILGMTDLLLETPLNADQKEYVDATRQCAENLLQLLNGALEYSALSSDQVRADETEFPLRKVLESVTAEFSAKALSKGLKFERKFDAGLPDAAIGDALRLRQLLAHLLSNAVKFTDTGEIEISAHGNHKEPAHFSLTVDVRDTGSGIAPERIHTIFQDFQGRQNSVTKEYGGLGLGLAVSQKLAKLLKGTITAASEVGRGSTFTVHLPLRLPSEIARPSGEKIRGRVLVVDDNSIAQTVASHALRRRSYEVQCASDGLAALEAASRCQFDVILLDLQMPGLDGFQTVERLRQMPAYLKTPVVAVTANCSDDYRDRCRESGMQGFLAKPVRTKDLVLTVDQYCVSGG